MCLESLGSHQKKCIKKLETREDGYVWLWKVFDLDKEDNLVAQFHDYNFYEGKNTAEGDVVLDLNKYRSSLQYKLGFHCFTTENDAHDWLEEIIDTGRNRVIVPVKVRKTWITAIGYQGGLVVVCKHIII